MEAFGEWGDMITMMSKEAEFNNCILNKLEQEYVCHSWKPEMLRLQVKSGHNEDVD